MVVLLALVDAKYRFNWASLGVPGNTDNSTYFQSTSLWDEINIGKVLPDKNCVVDGVETPQVILGNVVFPLRSWTMKPLGDLVGFNTITRFASLPFTALIWIGGKRIIR